MEIRSSSEFREWLSDTPGHWATMIAARAALRVLPILATASGSGVRSWRISVFRATFISWVARSLPTDNRAVAAVRAARAANASIRLAANTSFADVAVVAAAGDAAATAAATVITTTANAAVAAARSAARAIAVFVSGAQVGGSEEFHAAYASAWAALSNDCAWLEGHTGEASASREMSGVALWQNAPSWWVDLWSELRRQMLIDDPSYAVWINWFERRVRGEMQAFDIPGDIDGRENTLISIRLADATDEDFWNKGAAHVNVALQGWIDEARVRAARNLDPDVPKQDRGATAYGVNDKGQLDRLPPADQLRLRDIPDQRRAYGDIREAAMELAGEGQRLGAVLASAMERFISSLPERFEGAEAYTVWRDGNRLRAIYRKHLLAMESGDPDPARLDQAIAVDVEGLLLLFNNFAFDDDGLRRRDERKPPQEALPELVKEAGAGQAFDKALSAAAHIATDAVRADIQAEGDSAGDPGNDPYAAQLIEQANLTRRNRLAALFTAVRKGLQKLGSEVKRTGKSVREGAERELGKRIITDAAGETHSFQPILEFVYRYGEELRHYAAVAFSNFNLGALIDMVKRAFDQ